MKFKLNNSDWKIKEVEDIKEFRVEGIVLGQTNYAEQEILLLKQGKSKRRTLLHELFHACLWEYGHQQEDRSKFNYEDICNIGSAFHDMIHTIVEKYFRKEK